MKKLVFLIVLIALITAFFMLDLQQWLTLDGLKSGMQEFQAWRNAQAELFAVTFFLIYVAVTALSLPGAAILTLAAGALFGLLWGTILVSFASSIGASLAFLSSRYLLRDKIQKQFQERLSKINEGIEKEGAFYLFALRLVPVFPFFMINLLMGLSHIRLSTFYWISQLGMLIGTLVYVNAGTQLARLESLADVLSPALFISFFLLGVFPLLAKKLLDWIKAGKVYKNYKKPKQFDRNLIVIGAGAGGLVSAYIAAAVKAKVTLIEAHKMGGDCLNYGCVPSKALIKSASVAKQMQSAERYGLVGSSPEFSFRTLMQRVNDIIKAIEPHDSIERYTGLGVEVLQGHARLIDPWTVEINNAEGNVQRLSSRSIVLATGAKPFVPPLPGIETINYVTSDTIWSNFSEPNKLPENLLVLGAGPVGCELAQSFARLGSNVVLLERGQRILKKEDEDAAALVQASLQQDGVSILCQHTAVRCEKENTQQRLYVQYQGEEKAICFDVLLCAVGRVARLEGYGLEELGIETHNKIVTNQYLQTLYPNIYAAGDVLASFQLTHVAAHQAWYASVNALFGNLKKFKVDYRCIPRTTFVSPEVAQLGLNEQQAREDNIAYELTYYDISDLDRAIVDSSAQGFVKVLTVPSKDTILGVTIVAEHAGELIAEFTLAMKHGLGLNKILATTHVYPSWAEANKYAAAEWKRTHTPAYLFKWLEKFHQWQRD